MLPDPTARRSKFYYYFGEISLLPSQCPTKQMQYGRSGLVGGSIPPWSNVVQYISWIWCIRGYRHNFGTLTPSPIFPKICHYFGTFPPSRIFPKIYHNFRTSRIQILVLFCVSDILNLPHTTVALLNSPEGPQIFQACWSWVRVSFWCRWLCIGKRPLI